MLNSFNKETLSLKIHLASGQNLQLGTCVFNIRLQRSLVFIEVCQLCLYWIISRKRLAPHLFIYFMFLWQIRWGRKDGAIYSYNRGSDSGASCQWANPAAGKSQCKQVTQLISDFYCGKKDHDCVFDLFFFPHAFLNLSKL